MGEHRAWKEELTEQGLVQDVLMDVVAEQAVLGAILFTEGKNWPELSFEAFAEPWHREIYQAMNEELRDNKTLDSIAVNARLQRHSSRVPFDYVEHLEEKLVTTARYPSHVKTLQDRYRRRCLLDEAEESRRRAYDPELTTDEAAERNAAGAVKLLDHGAPAMETSAGSATRDAYKTIERMQAGEAVGHKTGFSQLDKIASPFQPGQYWVVGARPSMGKSAFGLGLGVNLLEQGAGVLFVSAEVSREACGHRLIAMHARVSTTDMRTPGKLGPQEWKRVSDAAAFYQGKPYDVAELSSPTVRQIAAQLQKSRKNYPIDVVVVDYLGYCRDPSSDNPTIATSNISKGLKHLARDHRVAVVALAQLSRNVEYRDDKRPTLADLRYSGAIEQDGDLVAFLYREFHYTGKSEDEAKMEILVRKQRDGATGTAHVRWLSEWTLVEDKNE